MTRTRHRQTAVVIRFLLLSVFALLAGSGKASAQYPPHIYHLKAARPPYMRPKCAGSRRPGPLR
ncbi:MAG: hypothetical protein HF973_19565 [Chloroflexi bacterium]|nr:hypothetical protein [Chloroflexota bacterium]